MLALFASQTGGKLVRNTNNVRRGLDRLATDLTSYYQVSFTPPADRRGGFRRLEIRVHGRGMHVRHQPGYYASSRSVAAPVEGG